jgi:hypothetical protein
MPKNLFLLLIIILFTTCKKDKQITPVTYDVTGKWTLYSYQTQIFGGLDVTADQYPCIAENVLTLNADFTSGLAYTGSDPCYVTPLGRLGTTIGTPGQPITASTWSLSGNTLYFVFPTTKGSDHGVIASVAGKLHLTTVDTIVYNSNRYTVTSVAIKQ